MNDPEPRPSSSRPAAGDGRLRAGASTRARLLEAATDLVAVGGADGMTVRVVSRVAGTNVAAVSYHFGSRDALLAAVVATVSEPVLSDQRAALDALEGDPGATPREWVVAWGRPLLQPAFSSDLGARRLGAIIGQALAAPQSSLGELVRGVVADTDAQLVRGLRRAMPEATEPDLRLRVAVMVTVVGGLATGSFATHIARSEIDAVSERVLDLLVAIATTPPSETR
jgi:AcrR family transcriptional regulator